MIQSLKLLNVFWKINYCFKQRCALFNEFIYIIIIFKNQSIVKMYNCLVQLIKKNATVYRRFSQNEMVQCILNPHNSFESQVSEGLIEVTIKVRYVKVLI